MSGDFRRYSGRDESKGFLKFEQPERRISPVLLSDLKATFTNFSDKERRDQAIVMVHDEQEYRDKRGRDLEDLFGNIGGMPEAYKYNPEIKRVIAEAVKGDFKPGETVVSFGASGKNAELALSQVNDIRYVSIDKTVDKNRFLGEDGLMLKLDLQKFSLDDPVEPEEDDVFHQDEDLGRSLAFLAFFLEQPFSLEEWQGADKEKRAEILERLKVDKLVFSDILNYVDYKKLLSTANILLKDGGEMLVINQAGQGFRQEFVKNDGGPDSSITQVGYDQEIIRYLEEELKMEVEASYCVYDEQTKKYVMTNEKPEWMKDEAKYNEENIYRVVIKAKKVVK